LAFAFRARSVGEPFARPSRSVRLVSGFDRFALLRVDLREGRCSLEGSSAYVALRPALFLVRVTFAAGDPGFDRLARLFALSFLA
jgi:hypothetical protein